MKLRLSRRAVRRLTEIADHLTALNPAAALDIEATIRASLDLLTRHPYAGRVIDAAETDGTVRVLAVPRRPYLVYYRVDDAAETATIITIRHAAQKRLD